MTFDMIKAGMNRDDYGILATSIWLTLSRTEGPGASETSPELSNSMLLL
jgi:hypothetical protein